MALVDQPRIHEPDTPSKPVNPFRFRRDIQGLRAVAVLLVILDHLFGWPRGGYIGVDIFFVISGFLITGLLLREGDRTGRVSIANFYRRRARRILPVSLLVLGATVTASYVLLLSERFHDVVVDAWWSLAFMVNWHLAAVGTDYFQSALPPSPLQHYWSLAVEEQFYLVWPLVLLLLLLPRRSGRPVVALFATAVIAASFLWAMHQSVSEPTVAYFSTFTRAWELAAGALLAAAATLLTRTNILVRTVMGAVGLAGILLSAYYIEPTWAFPAPVGAMPILSTCLVLAAGIGIRTAPGNWILTVRPLVYVGTVSFSLYLWHWPVIVLLESVMMPGLTYYITAVLLMSALTAASYHLIEKPILDSAFLAPTDGHRRGRRHQRPTSSRDTQFVIVGTLASILVLLAAAVFNQPKPEFADNGPAPVLASAAADRGQDPLQTAIKVALTATEFPPLTPPLDDIDSGVPDEMKPEQNCLDPTSISPDLCNYGSPDAPRVAVVVGDSVAMSWMPAIRGALEPNGFRIHGVAFANCPFIGADILVIEDPAGSQKCNDSHGTVIEQIVSAEPDLVIISDMEYAIERLVDRPGSPDAWRDARASIVEQLAASGARVVILSPDPFGKAATECATRLAVPSDCISDVSANWSKKRTADEAAARATGATFVDTGPWFCYRDSCPIFVSGILVRWDSGHITSNYGEYLIPRMKEALIPD